MSLQKVTVQSFQPSLMSYRPWASLPSEAYAGKTLLSEIIYLGCFPGTLPAPALAKPHVFTPCIHGMEQPELLLLPSCLFRYSISSLSRGEVVGESTCIFLTALEFDKNLQAPFGFSQPYLAQTRMEKSSSSE